MWALYSLIAALGFGVIALILAHLSRSNLSPLIVNTWFWASTAVLFLATSLAVAGEQLKLKSEHLKWFILLAIVAFVTNWFSVKALQVGPNVGLVRSVQFAQIVVAALGGYLLLHQHISLRAGVGMVLVVIGILLVANK
jgi:uncharacterized membrane protein